MCKKGRVIADSALERRRRRREKLDIIPLTISLLLTVR